MRKVLDVLIAIFMAIMVYFVYHLVPNIFVSLFGNNISDYSNLVKSLILLGAELITLIILVLMYIKPLINDLKNAKSNLKEHLPTSLIYWLLGFMGMGIMNITLGIFVGTSVSENEQLNREFFTKFPLYAIPVMTVIGPIIEEIVFRYSVRKIIPTKWLFVIVTSIVFAFAHIEVSFDGLSIVNHLTDLLYIFPYLSLAFAFSLAYRESDNICNSILIHIFHNTYCVIMLAIGLLIS